jgi:hypothetical protein
LRISWLSRATRGTQFDFDDPLEIEFRLVPVSEEAFDNGLV